MNIVHWEEIVEKHFGDKAEFEKITKEMIICSRTDIPVSKVFKNVTVTNQAAYDRTRWFMRQHGWYSAYMKKENQKEVLKFWCLVPEKERKYISLAKYMNDLELQGIEEDIDEYYREKGGELIEKVTSGLSEKHTRKDIYDDEGGYIND